MRCIDCAYDLRGLSRHACPECGRWFEPDDPTSYDTRPPFLRWTYWAPGFVIALLVGLLGFGFLFGLGATGWVVWLGVPACIGAAMGIYCKVRYVVVLLLAPVLCGTLIVSMLAANMSGLFCGIMLYAMMLIPVGAGVLLGMLVRLVLKERSVFYRAYLPVIVLVLGPVLLHAMGFGRSEPDVELSVSTTRVVAGSPGRVWETLMFFEDVESPPPLLMRIALPEPLRTSGSMARVGDRRVCVYTQGNLTKEITEVIPGRRLAFMVVEQGFEPSVRLTRGSFELDELGDGRTRLTLTTRYVPIHTPRFAWRWAEVLGARTLHTHVLNGMEAKLGPAPVTPASPAP